MEKLKKKLTKEGSHLLKGSPVETSEGMAEFEEF